MKAIKREEIKKEMFYVVSFLVLFANLFYFLVFFLYGSLDNQELLFTVGATKENFIMMVQFLGAVNTFVLFFAFIVYAYFLGVFVSISAYVLLIFLIGNLLRLTQEGFFYLLSLISSNPFSSAIFSSIFVSGFVLISLVVSFEVVERVYSLFLLRRKKNDVLYALGGEEDMKKRVSVVDVKFNPEGSCFIHAVILLLIHLVLFAASPTFETFSTVWNVVVFLVYSLTAVALTIVLSSYAGRLYSLVGGISSFVVSFVAAKFVVPYFAEHTFHLIEKFINSSAFLEASLIAGTALYITELVVAFGGLIVGSSVVFVLSSLRK